MLARIALRIAAVEAVRDKTDFGDSVFDSRIGVFDDLGQIADKVAGKKPFIAVYSDAGREEAVDLNTRSLNANGATVLLFETGIAESMALTDPDTDEQVLVTGVPVTDSAMEFQLDLVARQITDALTDQNDDWAEIFRGLCYRVERIERARTSSADGTRVAAHQIKLTVELIEDPVRGEPLAEDAPFARFLAKLETMPAPYPVYAAMMRAQIEGSNRPWEAAQRRLGMTRDELLALGLGPIAGDVDRSTPEFETGTVDMAGIGSAVDVEP